MLRQRVAMRLAAKPAPKLSAIPDSMKPFDLSPSYTPFPLPVYDPQTGFQPLKLDGVPDIQKAEQRMREDSASIRHQGEISRRDNDDDWTPQTLREAFDKFDTTWTRQRHTAVQYKDDEEEAKAEVLPFERSVTGTPLSGTHALFNFDARAVSERHLQYVEEKSHPQLQLLNCMRTLDDVLEQFRSTAHQLQAHAHMAALSDLTASVNTMPAEALLQSLSAIRATLPAGRGALYFPVFADVRKRNHIAVNTDFAKLKAYLAFFRALEDRISGFDEEARMPRILSQPQVFVDAVATAAHVQLLDRKGALAPPTVETGRDNLGPLNFARITQDEWSGDRILSTLTEAVEMYGDAVFDSYTIEQVAQLFIALLALCTPNVPLPSAPVRQLVATLERRVSHDSWVAASSPARDGLLCDVLLASTSWNIYRPALKDAVVRCAMPTAAALQALTRFKPRATIEEGEAVYHRAVQACADRRDDQLEVAASFLTFLKGHVGFDVTTTQKVADALKRQRLTETVLGHLAVQYPWLNEEERAARLDVDMDDGRRNVAANRLAESLSGLFGARDDGIVHGDATEELQRLRATLPTPGSPHTETLTVGPHIQRFAQVMQLAPRDKFTEAVFVHSDVSQRGPWAVTNVAESAINGQTLVVLTLTTLLRLQHVSVTDGDVLERLKAKACLQLLLFELQMGRAVLASAVDEVQVQGTRGNATEASVLVDVSARVVQRLVTAVPTFVLGSSDNPVKAFIDRELVMESKRSDGHSSSPDGNLALHKTRQHFLHHMQDMARFNGGMPRGDASPMHGVTDRTISYTDFRFNAKRRQELWSMQDTSTTFDKKFRDAGRRSVLRGATRNAVGTDMKYIGVYSPGHHH